LSTYVTTAPEDNIVQSIRVTDLQSDGVCERRADKVIKKYQETIREQLRAQEPKPPSEQEKMAIDFLHHDSQARVAFIDKIAAPVLNKMFECGLIAHVTKR
jgi:hypothetical protein